MTCILCIDFYDGNERDAVQEYQRRFPDGMIPSRSVFTRICLTLRDTGSLPNVFCSLKGRWYERLTHWIKAHSEMSSVILFSDEASFTRDGVNKLRKVHTWSHDNPHETSVTDFQRRFTVNVWCDVLRNKLIGHFVFDNLTGNAYEVFLRNELPGLLEDIPLMIRRQIYFQHDGAPPHYTLHVRDYLNESYTNRWLGRGGPIPWPPRSPNLTHLHFYIWGHMKTLVYETNVDSRAALSDRIFAAAEHIRNHLNNIGSATQSLLMRAENCITAGGGHFEQLL